MMTDINNPTEFAKVLRNVDATNEPEKIRQLIDHDTDAELMQSKSGKWYQIEDGELKQMEG